MERDREQALLAPVGDAVVKIEERSRAQPPVHADPDPARLLDDVEVVRLAARRRDVNRLLDAGDAHKAKLGPIGASASSEGDTGRERGE
jgi:hypothetical protein